MLLKVIFLVVETLKVMLILFKLMIAYTCGMVLHGLTVVLFKVLLVYKAYKVSKADKDFRVRKVRLVHKAELDYKVLKDKKVKLAHKVL